MAGTDYTSIQRSGGDTAMPLNLEKRLSVIVKFGAPVGKRLIDCGCGEGEYVVSLARLGVQAWGIEYDQEKVRRFGARHPSLRRLCVGDLESAGIQDAAFDVAVLNEVLEHVPDDAGALAEVHRILKNDGTLLVFSPNRRYPFETHGVHLARGSRKVPHYLPFVPYVPLRVGRTVFTYWARNYWPRELRRLIRQAGFTIVATDYVWQTFEAVSRNQPRWMTITAPLLRRISNLLERMPVVRGLGASQVIVARKQSRGAAVRLVSRRPSLEVASVGGT